jgi:hypothetical protein
MAQVNPDPHAHGYVFIPTNRVTGVFASYDDLQGALRALEPLGFEPQQIDVFAGEEGAELLDLCGQRYGIGTRIIRNIEALVSDDTALHQQIVYLRPADNPAGPVWSRARDINRTVRTALIGLPSPPPSRCPWP